MPGSCREDLTSKRVADGSGQFLQHEAGSVCVEVLCLELFFTPAGRICAEPLTSYLVGFHGLLAVLALTLDTVPLSG